jgi:hypothetical protein
MVWTLSNAGLLQQLPMAGGHGTTLATDQAGPAGIAAGELGVYWANRHNGTIMLCAR